MSEAGPSAGALSDPERSGGAKRAEARARRLRGNVMSEAGPSAGALSDPERSGGAKRAEARARRLRGNLK